MVKDFQLALTEPCAEQWDDMQQTSAGRYCVQCEKNIVDLTTKSDAELIKFFKNKDDNTCGRLLNSQLNRQLLQQSPKQNWHWLMTFALSASVVSPALAQQVKPVTVQNDHKATLPSATPVLATKSPALKGIITGRAVDQLTGEPIKGVTVKQKGFENVLAITDNDGQFQLKVSKKDTKTPYIFYHSAIYSNVETLLTNEMVVKLDFLVKQAAPAIAGAPGTISIGQVKRVSSDQAPLYVVKIGEKSCTLDSLKLSDISPDWIKSVDVIKDASATAIYGAKGANGVIIIGIKSDYEKNFDFSKKK